jgi:PKD repeat protein
VASGTPLTGIAPLTVNFSSAGSFDPEGGPLTYSWNFGDGNTSTDANPVHQYAAGGSYTATLTVTNTCGKTASDTVGVTAISILVACGRNGAAWSNDEGVTWNMSVGAPTGALNGSNFLLAKGTDIFLFSQIVAFVRVYRSVDLGQNFALVGSFASASSASYLAHPELTAGGRIIYPHIIDTGPAYRHVVSYSDDNGATWTASGAINGADVLWNGLPAIALLSSGVLAGAVYKSQAPLETQFYQSNDGGATWGAMISALSNNFIVGLWAFGTTLFVQAYDSVAGVSKLHRSTDGGATWPTSWAQPAGTAATSITKVGSRLFTSLENFPLAGQATVCYSDDDGQNWTQADVLATSTGEYRQSWCWGNTARFVIGFNRIVYGGNIGTFAAVGTAPAGILRGNAIARI